MKRLLLFSGFLLFITSSVEAQHIKLFRSIIYTSDNEQIDGILYDMTDSTIRYVPNQPDFVERLREGQTPPVFDIYWNTVNRLVIRRKGHVGRGLLIGTGIGVTCSIGLVAFTHPDGGRGIGALSDALRAAAIVAYPIGSAFYGTLTSLIPYKVKRIYQNQAAYKDAKATLKWRSVAAQRRVYLLTAGSDIQSVNETVLLH